MPDARSAAETLELADWRRRIAELYAHVRRLAAVDPVAGVELWRSVREDLYRRHPQSPVPAESRPTFRAVHFDHDPAFRFEVRVEPVEPAAAAAPNAPALQLPNSGADVLSFERIGTVDIPFADGPRRLSVFWTAGYAGGLFLPFRDATNGQQTYGAGRYLIDAAKSADLGGDPERGTLVLDFNFAYHPSCAFDPKWACPLAPPENRLDIPIRTGERLS